MDGLASPSQGLSSWYSAFKSFVNSLVGCIDLALCEHFLIHLVGNLVIIRYDRGGLHATGRAIRGGSPGTKWAIVPFESQGHGQC